MPDIAPMFQRFERRLDALEDIFTEWVVSAPPRLTESDVMFLEGLVSHLWQHWSMFCRRVVFLSALGCVTRSGKVIAACVAPPVWERVSYVAWRIHSGAKTLDPVAVNTDLKREPTWGDVQKVQNIVAAIPLSNAAHLVSCLGSVSRGPVDVQRVRNAAAHRNEQTFASVKGLNLYYNAKRLYHPIEVVTWTEPASRDFAFIAWIDEMRLLADLMTK